MEVILGQSGEALEEGIFDVLKEEQGVTRWKNIGRDSWWNKKNLWQHRVVQI